jgi:hypothetical protein
MHQATKLTHEVYVAALYFRVEGKVLVCGDGQLLNVRVVEQSDPSRRTIFNEQSNVMYVKKEQAQGPNFFFKSFDFWMDYDRLTH